jgi:DNA-binding NtrC family response regulator
MNVHVLRVPPLRDRASDIAELAHRFLAALCARFGMRTKRLDDAALRLLMAYDWRRNNVRELRNIIERMIIASDDDVIRAEHVPPEIAGNGVLPDTGDAHTFQALRAEAERRILLEALHRNDWHITNTAGELGLADHASLLKILRRHGIARPERG